MWKTVEHSNVLVAFKIYLLYLVITVWLLPYVNSRYASEICSESKLEAENGFVPCFL